MNNYRIAVCDDNIEHVEIISDICQVIGNIMDNAIEANEKNEQACQNIKFNILKACL